MANFLNDRTFLLKVNRNKVKEYHAAVMCLDFETEKPIARLEGKVISGNISIAANSHTRRTATLSVIFDRTTYNIADVLNLIAIDKKISLSIGITNPFFHTDEYRQYGEILWFKQGVFVITKANSSISTSSMTVSVNLSDKMCLLDGTCGGTLPASTSFHDRIIIDAEGNTTTEYPIIRDIIKECVHHFGQEHFSRISIEDVPSTGRIVMEYTGSTPINFATVPVTKEEQEQTGQTAPWKRAPGAAFVIGSPPIENFLDVYYKGDKVGYEETPLTYPGELIVNGGSNVCAVLDEIVKALGNYDYYYDTEGIFHFCQKNNFQATGDTPLNFSEEENNQLQAFYCPRYSPSLLINEFLDTEMVTQVSFNPNYSNIKNDYVYWGTRQGDSTNAANTEVMVRYHLAIDKRPEDIPAPTTPEEAALVGDDYSLCHKSIQEVRLESDDSIVRYDLTTHALNLGEKAGDLIAPALDTCFPDNQSAWFNWREELYRRALMAYGQSTEGSYYDEELLAEWRNIFDPSSTIEKKGSESFEGGWVEKYGDGENATPWTGYRIETVTAPEKLRYWLDFIDTTSAIGKYSINRIGRRSIVTEDSKVSEVYSREVNDIIFIKAPTDQSKWEETMNRVRQEYIPIGQTYCFIQEDQWVYFKEVNSYGTCYEGVRSQMYSNLFYNSSVSMTTIPILYLDGNQCIRVNFPELGITGDYVVNTIQLNLSGTPQMTMSLQEAMVVV